jgi:hypothetical protein
MKPFACFSHGSHGIYQSQLPVAHHQKRPFFRML